MMEIDEDMSAAQYQVKGKQNLAPSTVSLFKQPSTGSSSSSPPPTPLFFFFTKMTLLFDTFPILVSLPLFIAVLFRYTSAAANVSTDYFSLTFLLPPIYSDFVKCRTRASIFKPFAY